jgi:hypothetical protein
MVEELGSRTLPSVVHGMTPANVMEAVPSTGLAGRLRQLSQARGAANGRDGFTVSESRTWHMVEHGGKLIPVSVQDKVGSQAVTSSADELRTPVPNNAESDKEKFADAIISKTKAVQASQKELAKKVGATVLELAKLEKELDNPNLVGNKRKEVEKKYDEEQLALHKLRGEHRSGQEILSGLDSLRDRLATQKPEHILDLTQTAIKALGEDVKDFEASAKTLDETAAKLQKVDPGAAEQLRLLASDRRGRAEELQRQKTNTLEKLVEEFKKILGK